jgi:hypothetical protein
MQNTHLAYCSACDRQVRVVLQPGHQGEAGGPVLDASSVVCLEHGESCTGEFCPLFGVPTAQMRENLRTCKQAATDN